MVESAVVVGGQAEQLDHRVVAAVEAVPRVEEGDRVVVVELLRVHAEEVAGWPGERRRRGRRHSDRQTDHPVGHGRAERVCGQAGKGGCCGRTG